MARRHSSAYCRRSHGAQPWVASLASVTAALSYFPAACPGPLSALESRVVSTNLQEIPLKISMYQASAPRFVKMLTNLSAIVDKAQSHIEAKKIDPLVLTSYRLYPDMLPFTRQIMIATDTAKGAVARLSGAENPKYEDTEQTFVELKARIAKTIDFINSFRPEQIDNSEDKEIVLKGGGKETRYSGIEYLFGFALPNFYFHVTTAYDILRHNG